MIAPPPPPPKHHCNVLASVIVIAVVVVATIVTAGAAASLGGVAAAALAGAAGGAAGQLAGDALGVHHGFGLGEVFVSGATAAVGYARNTVAPLEDLGGGTDALGSANLIADSADVVLNTTAPNVEDYVAGLYTKATPTSTKAGLFEVEQTGPLNYRVTGGGTAIDVDGYQNTTLLDAKYVNDPAKSPYVDSSNVPQFLRDKILTQQQYEFERYQAVIADPNAPLIASTS